MAGSRVLPSMPIARAGRPQVLAARALLLVGVALALQHATPAEARGRHAGGWFAGGLVVGALLAPRYAIPAPSYYYPPRVYYAPPPVYYAPAPVYYPPPTYYSPPPVVYSAPPVHVQPPAPIAAAPATAPQALPIEDRLRRLRSLCDQGLFSAEQCQQRSEQILQEM